MTQEPKSQETVRELAALIREIDGNHSLGAGELAERLIARGVRSSSDSPTLREIGDEFGRLLKAHIEKHHAVDNDVRYRLLWGLIEPHYVAALSPSPPGATE